MSKSILFFLCLLLASTLSAQEIEIEGHVLDSERNDLIGAAVRCFDNDSLLVKSTVTDSKGDFTLHVPEGAIPKDGPSAGITMVTSIASTFTQRKVRAHLAMTGEITLRGRVLPVGGIKEKILAAKRAGIKEIILCEENRKDIEDIKENYLKGLKFYYVHDIKEVLDIALLKEKVSHPIDLSIPKECSDKE